MDQKEEDREFANSVVDRCYRYIKDKGAEPYSPAVAALHGFVKEIMRDVTKRVRSVTAKEVLEVAARECDATARAHANSRQHREGAMGCATNIRALIDQWDFRESVRALYDEAHSVGDDSMVHACEIVLHGRWTDAFGQEHTVTGDTEARAKRQVTEKLAARPG